MLSNYDCISDLTVILLSLLQKVKPQKVDVRFFVNEKKLAGIQPGKIAPLPHCQFSASNMLCQFK